MRNQVVVGMLSVFLLLPVAALAQGVPEGAAHGAAVGNRDAGPVGAVVGGAVGGALGGVNGVLGVHHHYRCHYYVYRGHTRRRCY
jgi:hypothetical protein